MSKSTDSKGPGSGSSKRSSSSDNDFDWIFDYILQFLESETFDHSIMNFIDEKCVHFDSEDENKFIYTDIHREFKDHVETLILSNLGELGITSELFYESCEKGRNGRDINRSVFERLVAMDDFLTFKKIMIKRNLELQLEAFRTFVNINSPQKDGGNASSYMIASPGHQKDTHTIDDIDDVLQQSLIEMELMHRQEQLEQAQLEQAVALSLAIEEERLRKLAKDAVRMSVEFDRSLKDTYSYNAKDDYSNSYSAKETDVQEESMAINYSIHNNTYRAMQVSAHNDDAFLNSENNSVTTNYKGEQLKLDDDNNVSIRNKTKQSNKNTAGSNGSNLGELKFADPKPLKLNSNILGARPLPAINVGKSSSSSLNDLTHELNKKKEEMEISFKENQKAIQHQKEESESLRKHLKVDPDEAEKRAVYMREQRDRLIAMKKAERDKANGVNKSSGRFDNNNEDADKVMEAISRIQSEKVNPSGADAKDCSPERGLSTDEIERRRSIMAMALARRMKLELIEREESRLTSKYASDYSTAFDGSGAFTELDKGLKSMAMSRVDNKERQVLLTEKNKIALKKKSQVVETDIDDGYYN